MVKVNVLFLLIIISINLLCGQLQFYKLDVDDQMSCMGQNTLAEYLTEIEWNLNDIHNPNGSTKTDSNLGPTKQWRATLCGGITEEIASCSGESSWCFEETYLNGTCITGIVNWDSESIITYYAVIQFNSDSIEDDISVLGIRVRVNDSDDNIDKTCPNGDIIVNYDVVCRLSNETIITSVSESIDGCEFNVSIHSQYGCVESYPVTEDILSYPVADGPLVCTGGHNINDLDSRVEWNMEDLYNPEGYEFFDVENNILYRTTICSPLLPSNTICNSSMFELCLETTSEQKETCIAALASWGENAAITAYALGYV